MRFLITILVFAVSTSLHAESIDQTLTVDRSGTVNIEVVDGNVTIIAWDKPEVRVVGEVSNPEESFEFKTSGDDTYIEVENEHGYWGRRNNHGSTSIKVYCPADSSIRAEGASATYSIKGIRGSVEVSTMSGNIDLEGGEGKVELESISGDVVVKNSKGKLNLASVSGDITANALASSFDAESVSGDIRAKVGSAESVELESVSGDIEIIFTMANKGRLDADTVSGDIDIEFENDDINASFDIETGPGGDIRNRISDDKSSNSFSLSGSLDFKVGKGDGSVNIETMSGTVTIDK
jgi:DUF4097 and DUF4098 domain-containing protein YvlB